MRLLNATCACAPASNSPDSRACGPADVEARIATDNPLYPPLVAITFTITLRNRSSTACHVPVGYCAQVVRVLADDGTQVWQSSPTMDATPTRQPGQCQPPGGYPLVQPGESARAQISWDQRYCPMPSDSPCTGSQVPIGRYTAHSYWYSDAYLKTTEGGSASFEIL